MKHTANIITALDSVETKEISLLFIASTIFIIGALFLANSKGKKEKEYTSDNKAKSKIAS